MIDRIGHVERAVDTDLFSSVVHHIVGQQISTKAQATIWAKMQAQPGTVDAESILALPLADLQALGISLRKENLMQYTDRYRSPLGDILLQPTSLA